MVSLVEEEAKRILNELVDVTSNPLNGTSNTSSPSGQVTTRSGQIPPSTTNKKSKPNPLLNALQQLEDSGVISVQDAIKHPKLAPLLAKNPQAALTMIQGILNQRAQALKTAATSIRR